MSTSALYPPVPPREHPLRIGVMLDDWAPAEWMVRILEDIQSSGFATVCTVILNNEPQPQPQSFPRRLWRLLTTGSSFRSLLWEKYVQFDARRHPELGKVFAPRDVSVLLKGAAVIETLPLRKGFVHRFEQEDIERIRLQELDVILRFGFNVIRGEILKCARHGVWSYHHGDNNEYRGGPAAFWEMYERNPLTGVILQVLTDELDGGQVVCRSYCPTQSFDSLLVNRVSQYRTGMPFVMRCLRQLASTGKLRVEPPGPPYKKAIYRTPRNSAMFPFVGRTLLRKVVGKFKILAGRTGDHWELLSFAGAHSTPPARESIRAIRPPTGHFWADPCVVTRDSREYVFFEDLHYSDNRGRIAVFEFDETGSPQAPRTVLDEPYHLSYPYVFRWQGCDYMIPETGRARAVRLYRAVHFPDRWEFVQEVLSGVHAVDATLHNEGDDWYLFVGASEAGGSTWVELFLFVSSSPLGPWAPHPMNPVVSDVRGARPAGALFRRDGALYRPAQDCSAGYGARIAVNKVLELSPTRYAESLEYHIDSPVPKGTGCHTISLGSAHTLLDVKFGSVPS